ncbi:AMP-binding protein [Clostridium yunnanense]
MDYSNELAFIMSTSGTTGIPKRGMLSPDNIISNLQDIDEYFKLSDEDHVLSCNGYDWGVFNRAY